MFINVAIPSPNCSGDSGGRHAHCGAEVLSTVMTVECFMKPRVSGSELTDGDIAVESVIDLVKQQYEIVTLRWETLSTSWELFS